MAPTPQAITGEPQPVMKLQSIDSGLGMDEMPSMSLDERDQQKRLNEAGR